MFYLMFGAIPEYSNKPVKENISPCVPLNLPVTKLFPGNISCFQVTVFAHSYLSEESGILA